MILEVTDVKKSFAGREILKGVNLRVEKGDVISIIGPSGAGKTTLLRCMNFLERADSGKLRFFDRDYDLSGMSKRDMHMLRQKTAFVFQNYNLFLHKTALQNVTEPLTVVRKMKRKQAEEQAIAMLEKVGVADKAASYPRELSGGQQQRVAIARALSCNPDIVYFDEPTSALDPELTGGILSVMKELAAEGLTMIVVTHEMAFARHISTKVVFMEEGRVLEQGSPADLFGPDAQERVKAFISSLDNSLAVQYSGNKQKL